MTGEYDPGLDDELVADTAINFLEASISPDRSDDTGDEELLHVSALRAMMSSGRLITHANARRLAEATKKILPGSIAADNGEQ